MRSKPISLLWRKIHGQRTNSTTRLKSEPAGMNRNREEGKKEERPEGDRFPDVRKMVDWLVGI